MKDNVEIYTLALIRVIHDSDVYKDYKAVKNRLSQDPELKSKVNQYRSLFMKEHSSLTENMMSC